MNKIIFAVFIVISVIITSCADVKDTNKTPKMGAKDGVCYSSLTCNSGLICIDMICEDDPCYDVVCDSWKTCEDGSCKLLPNRCDQINDCNESALLCDVGHSCVFEENPCDGQNCSGAGKCFIDSETKTAVCNCDSGYNHDLNPLECIKDEEIDLCKDNNCNPWESCNSTNGNCELVSGRCDTDRDCLGNKICDDNNNCVDPVNPCVGITCSNNGTCVIDPVTEFATCNCDVNHGYFPDASGLNCKNPCLGHENCEGYGECKPTSSTDATCDCLPGYISNGLSCVENDLCANNNCSEWRPCEPSSGACVLASGRCDGDGDCSGGQICDANHSCITPDNPCDGQECSNHGNCVVDGNGNAKCDCDTEHHYYPSGLSCLNPCEGENCSGNGLCVSSDAVTATCTCTTGFHPGAGLTCIEDDPCENINCTNTWEECRSGSCELIAGMCEEAGDCPSDTPACVNHNCVNLCDDVDCGDYGQCTSDSTDTLCICETGYTGDNCELCDTGFQDNNNNGICEPYTVWCKLQAPASINQEKDSLGELVFARVYVEGITETTTEASSVITAQLGYTPYDVTSPVVEGNFFWVDASYNSSCTGCEANNDEYMVNFPTDMAGDYKYIYRVSVDSGNSWLYCDLNGSGGLNNDPFEADQVGDASITGVVENPITELFISEYVDGSSGSNKAIEIYNGTDNPIDLSDYELWKVANGGTWFENKISLTGTLNSGDVYVVCNSSEDTLPSVCDLRELTITTFNGDDAIGLAKNGTLIDAVGTDGGDPGTGWDVAGVTDATADHVLRRKHTIMQGNINWDSSRGTNETDSEWLIFVDDFTNLGSSTPTE